MPSALVENKFVTHYVQKGQQKWVLRPCVYYLIPSNIHSFEALCLSALHALQDFHISVSPTVYLERRTPSQRRNSSCRFFVFNCYSEMNSVFFPCNMLFYSIKSQLKFVQCQSLKRCCGFVAVIHFSSLITHTSIHRYRHTHQHSDAGGQR